MGLKWKCMPGFGAATLLALCFLYAPLVLVVVFSFNASPLITVWEGFSADWYARAIENRDLRRAAFNSLAVACGASLFSTLIALCCALSLRENGRHRKIVDAFITLPLLAPEIVIAIATMSFFAAINFSYGLLNVLMAHVVFCIPFAFLPIRARLAALPASLYEATADLYATPWRAFRHVTLPLLMPAVIAGALLAFITSLDDYIITQMVAPPGAATLPVYIYSMVRRGITPEINAVSALILLFSVAIVFASFRINYRKG